MPALANARHELFAQAIFKGSTADAAYSGAGYNPNRGNAAALNAKQYIRSRVAELQAAAAKKAIDAISFDAVDQFRRLEQDIERAAAAGNFVAVMKGHEMRLQAFGYLDSPTLTHEHVKGKPLAPAQAETVLLERDERTAQVVRFPKLMALTKRS